MNPFLRNARQHKTRLLLVIGLGDIIEKLSSLSGYDHSITSFIRRRVPWKEGRTKEMKSVFKTTKAYVKENTIRRRCFLVLVPKATPIWYPLGGGVWLIF